MIKRYNITIGCCHPLCPGTGRACRAGLPPRATVGRRQLIDRRSVKPLRGADACFGSALGLVSRASSQPPPRRLISMFRNRSQQRIAVLRR